MVSLGLGLSCKGMVFIRGEVLIFLGACSPSASFKINGYHVGFALYVPRCWVKYRYIAHTAVIENKIKLYISKA